MNASAAAVERIIASGQLNGCVLRRMVGSLHFALVASRTLAANTPVAIYVPTSGDRDDSAKKGSRALIQQQEPRDCLQ